MDEIVATNEWAVDIDLKYVINSLRERLVSHLEYVITTPESYKANVDEAPRQVVVTSTALTVSFDNCKDAAVSESIDIPFQINLRNPEQDLMNAYGKFLVEANRRLDKLLNDTQATSDYIDRYLEEHG